MNLPETAAARNPRSINDRRSQQCARPGWCGRKRALGQHATIIAEAIRRHRAAGNTRWIQPYEYTPSPTTQALVQELLAAEAAFTAAAWNEGGPHHGNTDYRTQ